MSGSMVDWIAQSRYGRVEYQLVLALVEGALEVLIDGPMFVNPRK